LKQKILDLNHENDQLSTDLAAMIDKHKELQDSSSKFENNWKKSEARALGFEERCQELEQEVKDLRANKPVYA
jgi:chromosome segregation ATPase